jgi:chromosome condensin MukBEF complex kleisin-like MukF subunit
MTELFDSLPVHRLSPEIIEEILNAVQAEKEDSDQEYWKKKYYSLRKSAVAHITLLQNTLKSIDPQILSNAYCEFHKTDD